MKELVVEARRIATEAILEYSSEEAPEKHSIRAGKHVAIDHPAFQAALAALKQRTFDPVADVEEFHKRFKIEYAGKPRSLDFDLAQFRLKFMREEINEYEKHADAANFLLGDQLDLGVDQGEIIHHLSEMLDALADLIYVALGTAHLQGFDFRAAWKRVHDANMSKIIEASASSAEHRMKLKLTKPPGWEAPDHKDLVEDHAHAATLCRKCGQQFYGHHACVPNTEQPPS